MNASSFREALAENNITMFSARGALAGHGTIAAFGD
jgi:hypothetical protein